jgi:predicted RecB family nuclease
MDASIDDSEIVATPDAPILLTAYDAKRCARRIHNEWDPSIEKAAWEIPAELQMRFEAGVAFEATIFEEIRAALAASQYADLSEAGGKAAAVAATERAMDNGVAVIIGGWLADDVDGGRSGKPDVLLRVDGGYVAGDVKTHRLVHQSTSGALTYSTFENPAFLLGAEGLAAQTSSRLDDYLQLAHYWRMLQSAGRTPPGPASGFVIGKDDIPDLAAGGHLLVWADLDAPLFTTYSRSEGRAKRSALQRYDHEHGFRLLVARAAVSGAPALVEPIFTEECDACPWFDYCRGITGDDVASAHITAGRLRVREWKALASAGIVTVGDLAALAVDDEEFQAQYLPEVTHIDDPIGRLATAVHRARMIRDGISLERTTSGPIDIPRADIEIDFDIEWDLDDQVYLWGALVSRPGEEPAYRSIVSWDDLDADAALVLAREFAVWLRDQITAADEAGQQLLVYHYAHPEPRYLKRLLGETAAADLLARFVDLLPIVRSHYFGLHGLGIKKVAPEFGFIWRDEEPGGLQSQLWLQQARSAQDDAVRRAAQQRILAYNEDDVRATAAVRNGL